MTNSKFANILFLSLIVLICFTRSTVSLSQRTETRFPKESLCFNSEYFSFSKEMCPGGVLFKKPIQLPKECEIIGTGLKYYESCSSFKNEKSVEALLDGGEVRIVVPIGHHHNEKTPPHFDIGKSTAISCKKDPPIVRTDHNFRSFDNELFDYRMDEHFQNKSKNRKPRRSGRKPRTKREVSSSHSPLLNMDDYVEKRIAEFVSTLNKWRRQAEDEVGEKSAEPTTTATPTSSQPSEAEVPETRIEPPPETPKEGPRKTSRIPDVPPTPFETALHGVIRLMDIMENDDKPGVGVGREKLNTERLFSSIFKIVDLVQTDGSGRKIISTEFLKTNEQLVRTILLGIGYRQLKSLDMRLGEDVVDAIRQCQAALERRNDGLRFHVDENKCPPEVTSFVHPKTFKKISIATLKQELPQDLTYQKDEEDFSLSVTWKAVDIAHSACYAYWMDNNMGTVPFNFIGFVDHLFRQPTFQEAMYPSGKDGLKKYNGIIPTEKELDQDMADLDTLVAAVHHVSRFKEYFEKPNRKDSAKTEDIIVSRKRRSVSLEDFELFEGQAYCLQNINSNLNSGYHNSYPRIMSVCQ